MIKEYKGHCTDTINQAYSRLESPPTFKTSSDLFVRPFGTYCRPFVLGEEDKVIVEQLELGTVLESTLSRLGFIVDVNEFLPRIQLVETRRTERTRPGVYCILTTTRDFFAPRTMSLERYGSPSGYNAVVSLWNPRASITTWR
jgi:hypothetical protein